MSGNAIKLTGFRELHDALGDFTKPTERALLKRVATRALEPFAETARSLAPTDQGDLVKSVVVGTKLNKAARREARRDPVRGVRVFAGTNNPNGTRHEFGTLKHRATPFMAPAWDAHKGQIIDDVAADLKGEIERTAARVKKRKG